MTTREVFINNKHQLRAGWRIAIYTISFIILTIPFAFLADIVSKTLKETPLAKDAVVTAIFAIVAGLTAYILLRFLDKRKFVSIGLLLNMRSFKELAWGLLIGFIMLTVAVGLMWVMGYEEISLAQNDSSYFLLGFLGNILLYIAVGFNEEILFRGYIFQVFIEGTNKWIPLITLSLLFGVAHLGNPNVSPFGFANIVLAGALLSLAYIQTKSLWLPIGIHIAWNFTQGYIWGLPVSGTTVVMPLTVSMETGPDMITGGSFGPEGGAMCTLVCAAACIFVWKFFKPSEEMEKLVQEAVMTMPFKPAEAAAEPSEVS
ncbi:CPBP family intramembrane metalloprotease [bacterium]|nr:CPBP family intramembrane metalloprotease [bacterium]